MLAGLQEILIESAPNAVICMLSGKAIVQDVCVAFIVDATLIALILRSELDALLQ